MSADTQGTGSFAGARCVVTGGLGFIGSTLVHRLVAEGADVVVVDALVAHHGGDRRNVEGLDVEVLETSIGSPEVADAARGCDLVFNLAGQVSHLASMREPRGDVELNFTSHVSFLETLRSVAPRARVVLTSTRQVYGRPRYLPVDEDHPTAPVDVNGIDKLACEQFHLLYSRTYGLRSTVLRLTNVYGPRLHLDRPDQGFLSVFIRRAIDGDDIELFGDGAQQRDCLYVDDVVEALLGAVSREEAVGEIFNLGNAEVLPLSEIARLVVEAAGTGSNVRYAPWPDGLERIDIGSYQGDFGKSKRVLGWVPTTRFGDGIAATIEQISQERATRR
jgi:nucleoside-diphosphate-sugar epimerase